MDRFSKKLTELTIAIATFGIPTIVFSQGLRDAGKNLRDAAQPTGIDTTSDLGSIVGVVINAVLSLVGLIFLLLMVYAGYLWMTARGEETQVDKAKGIIRASIIGLVITLSAYAITAFVTSWFFG